MEADTELLQRLAEGQTDALGELAARYERDLLGLARALTGSADIAEEVVQDAWLRVIRSAATFQSKASVRTWLYRIVINRSRDVRRKESRRLSLSRSEPRESESNSELAGALRREVRALPDHLREALLLCHHSDLTHEQAASILALPLGTLKTRLRSARTRLERALSKEVSA